MSMLLASLKCFLNGSQRPNALAVKLIESSVSREEACDCDPDHGMTCEIEEESFVVQRKTRDETPKRNTAGMTILVYGESVLGDCEGFDETVASVSSSVLCRIDSER
jgi:hypothetical protein